MAVLSLILNPSQSLFRFLNEPSHCESCQEKNRKHAKETPILKSFRDASGHLRQETSDSRLKNQNEINLVLTADLTARMARTRIQYWINLEMRPSRCQC